MTRSIIPTVLCALLLTGAVAAQGKLAVVTATSDLADFARRIGGDRSFRFRAATRTRTRSSRGRPW